MDDTRRAWIRIGLAEGVGPRTWGPLVEELGDPVALVRASVARLSQIVKPERARKIADALAKCDVEGVVEDSLALAHVVATPVDDDWPEARFEGLSDRPALLFRQGAFPGDATPSVALVGTREASRYGLDVARDLAEALARHGVCVVSGFALGIDAAAHAGALAGHGHTVGVLGAGLDMAYPVANADLREDLLAQGGTLISEHPPGVGAERYHFPRRNRLVAALADVVVVVEAPAKSGALITAGMALDLGRTVLAVPGHVRRRTQAGCHALIRDGAGLCASHDDILAALDLEPSAGTTSRSPEVGPAFDVWQHIDLDDAKDLDTLALETGLSVGALLSALASLEVGGFVKRVPGVGYVRQ